MHLTSLEGFIGFNRVPYTSMAPNKIKDLWEGKNPLQSLNNLSGSCETFIIRLGNWIQESGLSGDSLIEAMKPVVILKED